MDAAAGARRLKNPAAPRNNGAASRCCATSISTSPAHGHHRDHRPVRHRQEHAHPLHQPARRADGGPDPVRRRRTSRGCRARALREARRRIGMVFQEYNLVERLTVMENLLTGRLGYVSAWQGVAAQVSADRHRRARSSCSTSSASRVSRNAARRRAVGRPAPARGHRARGDAAAAAAARRRADVVARSEDVGRDHGAAARHRGDARGIPVHRSTCTTSSSRGASPTASSACPAAASCSTARRPGSTDAHLKQIYGGEDWLQ